MMTDFENSKDDFELSISDLPDRDAALLFLDWFGLLARKRLGVRQSGILGADTWNFKVSDTASIKIRLPPNAISLQITSPTDFRDVLTEIAEESRLAAIRRDGSPGTWWSASLSAKPPLNQQSMLHMMRTLGTFKRFEGTWRLGRTVRLTFSHEGDPGPTFVPKLTVETTFRTPGAGAGPFSRQIGVRLLPRISSVVSFCVGSPLQLFPALSPALDEDIAATEQDLTDPNIHELHCDGIPIWSVLEAFVEHGALEAAIRVLGAIAAYEEGMLQRTQHAAMMFFISAIEALTVPNLPAARDQRINKRFAHYLIQFCTDDLQRVMVHGNFKQAFGAVSSAKDLVDLLYSARSRPVHTGHFGQFVDMGSLEPGIRVALVSDLVRASILSFLRRPVSLLWGHPSLDPSVRVMFDPHEYTTVQASAKAARMPVEKWIRQAAVRAAG